MAAETPLRINAIKETEMKKNVPLFLCLLLFFSSSALAERTHIANTYPTLGRGVRPLGMGNAFLTMQGTDENALFYNPAAIHDYSRDLTLTTGILPPSSVELNYVTIQLVKDVFDFQDDLDKATTDSDKIDTFKDFVDSHIGKFYSMAFRLPIAGAYNRWFAASLISDDRIDISFRNRAFPNFEIRTTSLSGIALGSAYGLLDETLSVGLATKILYGIENEQIITTSDILTQAMDDFKWKEWKRGMGVGFDLGAKYHIPDFGVNIIDVLQPTVAVVYQDIGNTRFIAMKKNGGPEKLPQTVSAGVGVHPTFGTIDTSLEVDFRELNVKEDLLLKLNVGAEARFPRMAGIKPSLRGGMQQSYPTVGCGLEIWKVTWNFAFFGKEVGQTTRQKAGYRLASEIVWRF